MVNKPNLLIPITIQFSVRYIIRTGLIRYLKEFCNPCVVLSWDDPQLTQELHEYGVDSYTSPKKQIGRRYLRLYKQVYQWQLKCINSPTAAIDRRRNNLLLANTDRLRITIRDAIFRSALYIPGYTNYILKRQKSLFWQDTNISDYVGLLNTIKPDVIFSLTPFFIEEELLLRAADTQYVPIIAAYLSFDNITTRNYVPIHFSEYFVWNKYNREELWRAYPYTRSKKVTIVGAPQFDFYYDKSYLWKEADWRKELGLPTGRPVILFGSTGRIIAPHEGLWLTHLDEAINRGDIQDNPLILLRRHPNDSPEYWLPFRSTCKNVIFDEPWKVGSEIPGKTNITRRDIERLTSTLNYCAVHVNASSTMTVDGSIFDRPQIGPAYDENEDYARVARELYQREHYLPITRSGGLDIVYSKNEFIRAINSALQNPGQRKQGRRKLVEEICTYSDGKSTNRVADALIKSLIHISASNKN